LGSAKSDHFSNPKLNRLHPVSANLDPIDPPPHRTTTMFLQRSAVAVARRVAVVSSPMLRRSIATTAVRRKFSRGSKWGSSRSRKNRAPKCRTLAAQPANPPIAPRQSTITDGFG